MTQNDYILVTGSRNLNDGSSDSDDKVHEEGEDASFRALESQGISILDIKSGSQTSHDPSDSHGNIEPRDQFSQELMNEGGIEILREDEEDSFL